MTVEVIEAGALTSVQEPTGRRHWRHLGVPVGGAADGWSAWLANRLVGNAEDAALLEMTLAGPTLRFTSAAVVAVTGGLRASLDGVPIGAGAARAARAGAILGAVAGDGARGYLSVAGGVLVDPVLGSTATDLRTGFGGLEGRALRAGDRLAVGVASGVPMRWTGTSTRGHGAIRILPGAHDEGIAELVGRTFRVSVEADRTGVRLAEALPGGGEAPSTGLPLGAIQVPPDGRPIVMLVDRPVTGGYRVPAVVIGADVRRVAQLRPGDSVRFEIVSLEEAREARRRADEELAALVPLAAGEDDELGWAGSHG